MSAPEEKMATNGRKCAKPLPPLEAGRQVGWIFKNGEVVAITRQDCDATGGDERH
jgi:hypothetical protein